MQRQQRGAGTVSVGSVATRYRPRAGLARNDPRQYDELAGEWWAPKGAFAMLRWIARARASLVPPARGEHAVLVDLACGAGLLAPFVEGLGYRHVGVDLTGSALDQAAAHGVLSVKGDVAALPIESGVAEVVVAGEILEHVEDLEAVVAECCRVVAPGGLIVLDTIADTRLARVLVVELAERFPGGAPPGIHDPSLFVNRARLVCAFARHGVDLELSGLRPSLPALLAFRAGWTEEVPMINVASTAVLFQGVGRRRSW